MFLGTRHVCCPGSVLSQSLSAVEGGGCPCCGAASGSAVLPSHAQPSLGSAPHSGAYRHTGWEPDAPGPWQDQGLSCHGGHWICVCAGSETGSFDFFFPSLMPAAPGKSFIFLARYLDGGSGSLEDTSCLSPPGLGVLPAGSGSATPVPALLADAEHPPGLCWWLLSRAWCSAVPGSVACQPCGPRCRVGSRAERSAVPTFAGFVMAWPQSSSLQGVWGGGRVVSVCV